MLTRFLTWWHAIRASLWALPVTAVLGATILAIGAAQIRISNTGNPAWYLFSGDAGDVSNFLANLTSAVMTLATLVISITMVVLTLAAQQLGPRLIASFMSDQRTQMALALFVGTAAYLLILLRITSGQVEGVPNIALTLASILVGLNVIMLPVFVHHLARSIVADNVVQRVGAALDHAIRDSLPEHCNDGPDPELYQVQDGDEVVRLPNGGYVQVVDIDRLVEAAAENNALILLHYRAGQHVLPGSIGAWVRSTEPLSERLTRTICEAVLFGHERTPVQDLEFWMRQLVEVGVRALSPGQNDPYTAIAAIDRIAMSLRLMMDRAPARPVRRDDGGTARLVMPVSTFEGLLNAAFDQFRQYGAAHPAVVIRVAEKLAQLWRFANDEQRPAIEKHLALVLEAGRREIVAASDREDLERHVAAALDERSTPASDAAAPQPPAALAQRLQIRL